MDEKTIKVEVKFAKQFYPKYDETIEDGDFGIVSWEIINVIEGNPIPHPIFDTITTKGNMCSVNRLETYTIIAREAPNEYGMQYDLLYVGQPADLSTVQQQKIFLSKILTEKQVEELFNTFDSPITHIIDKNIKELTKVKGIGEHTAQKIIEKYENSKDYSKAYIELDSYGLTNNMVQKLVDTYMSPDIAIKKIKENPYILATEVDGIGFIRADDIALENGLEWDSIQRIKAYIQYYLKDEAEKGNSYVYANYLMYEIEDNLGGVGNENIGIAMKELVEDEIVGLEDIKNDYKRVYLVKYKELEQKVCDELLRILDGENRFEFGDWEDKIKRLELKQGWEYTKEQWKGIQLALKNQVCVITGSGGTGKTSVVSAMLEALNAKSGKYSFSQTALSGRASAKLQEVTGEEGMTIHRLLGYNPIEGFKYNKKNKLPLNLIILDEISLVGGNIFLKLIEAIQTGSKLIIIGDDGQLESIGCMNLAKDLIECGVIPVIKLTEIHRQAKKSGIITESVKIRQGEQLFDSYFEGIDTRGELQDFELNIMEDKDYIRQTMVNYFKEWYPKVKDIMNIQLLVPVKERGDCCVAMLNDDIQQIYNPPTKTKKEIEVILNKKKDKKYILREKDKVMILKNNYKTLNQMGDETPIFNGWMGTVQEIDEEMEKAVKVYFPIIDDVILVPLGELQNVQLGYASTIHKMQGSDSDVIIGGIDYSTPPFMRTKELVYTLVTRAKKHCILVAQNAALREAIDTSGVSEKNTFLKEMLRKNLSDKYKKDLQ